MLPSAFPAEPSRVIRSADGTPVAVFTTGDGPPLVLVHGTTADHLTWRISGPLLARHWTLHAVDRRGRGASGDALDYAIEREYEDLAAIVDTLAAQAGRAVPVVGHSLGGRIALGAATLTGNIERLVAYESAPAPPGSSYERPGVVDSLREHLARGDRESTLATFMTVVVGMTEADLERFRADPVWPLRVAAAHTIVRELEAAASPAASLDALGGVDVPVLQILGGDSVPIFGEAVQALDRRLESGSVVTIAGARHAAHHTHAPEFVATIETFLGG
jgi:pimeloyl-ACP methyl ester carboxylesterase